jgi:arsenate reductase
MPLTRVLFVCIGNSCRSQMAEGFARTYGSDVIEASSAGTAPATIVAEGTLRAMREKNIDLNAAFPKPLDYSGLAAGVDLIVNMSGRALPLNLPTRVETWDVRDPIGCSEEVFRQVAAEIERRVMSLIIKLRGEAGGKRTASPSRRRFAAFDRNAPVPDNKV